MNTRLQHTGPLARLLLAAALGVALGAGALVWTRTELLSLRYERENLARREAQLRNEVEKLRVEEAALTSQERIEEHADRLQLRYPAPGQVLRVPTGAGIRKTP